MTANIVLTTAILLLAVAMPCLHRAWLSRRPAYLRPPRVPHDITDLTFLEERWLP